MIDVRHHIEHPFLSEYGGHIGFAVRPTKRRRGYAREMLGYALDYARELGLKDVMLGCYADNLGSIKTITGCGGKLLDEKLYEDGKPMHIYWISLY
jgi:predicted acetyltransferase